MTYQDYLDQTQAAPATSSDAPAVTPAVTTWPAQAFLSTVRVGIDINGDVWQYQGPTLGVVKVGTGAIPQAASQPD